MTAPMTDARLDELRRWVLKTRQPSLSETIQEIDRLRAAMIEDTEFTLAEEGRLHNALASMTKDRDRMERVSVTLAKRLHEAEAALDPTPPAS